MIKYVQHRTTVKLLHFIHTIRFQINTFVVELNILNSLIVSATGLHHQLSLGYSDDRVVEKYQLHVHANADAYDPLQYVHDDDYDGHECGQESCVHVCDHEFVGYECVHVCGGYEYDLLRQYLANVKGQARADQLLHAVLFLEAVIIPFDFYYGIIVRVKDVEVIHYFNNEYELTGLVGSRPIPVSQSFSAKLKSRSLKNIRDLCR